jgi:succinyl-diaminopimelate desuccinylase
VTPARGEVFDVLEAALRPLGFDVHRWVLGEPPDGPTENMVAIRGSGSPHFGFAGHLDVVPAGEGWSGDPFEGRIVDGRLVGRGANDMKSAIAAFVAAVSRTDAAKGTVSLLITGDEEGYATYGTPRIIDWLNERLIRPDMILIGEPTSVARLGDTVKIGRRGSVNMWIDVPGVQGHVAYPPPRDESAAAAGPGSLRRWMPSTSTTGKSSSHRQPRIHVDLDPDQRQQRHPRLGNRAAQHPLQQPAARHRSGRMVEEVAQREAPGAEVAPASPGEAFLTPPGQTVRL